MLPWIKRSTLDLDLDTLSRGISPQWPEEVIQSGSELLQHVMEPIPKKAKYLAYLLSLRTLGRFNREMKVIAKVIEADWREVALANLSYDLVIGSLGCSTIVFATPDGPVIARNMDWSPEEPLARASYHIRTHRDGKLLFQTASFPGASGVVSGLSSRGFAIIVNAISTPEKVCKTGYPVLLFVRKVIETAGDYDHALRLLSRQKLTTGVLFTLVGTLNRQRVVIERKPSDYVLRYPEGNNPLITTNDYRIMKASIASKNYTFSLFETTCHRYQRLEELFANRDWPTEIHRDEMLYSLSDPQVMQSITAQHVLIWPARNELELFVPRKLIE